MTRGDRRRRRAVARTETAFMHRACYAVQTPMLILDEATSSIDTRTEVKIQAAFTKLMEGRTTFIVAHRLSTIREADVILVMKDGKVIEQGNHESLMAADGFYRHLYESQFLRGKDEDK